MNKTNFFVYGGIVLIGHLAYLETHEAMHTITKPGVTSIDAYIWPTMLHDLGSTITSSGIHHLIG